jgi:hypothetical protein
MMLLHLRIGPTACLPFTLFTIAFLFVFLLPAFPGGLYSRRQFGVGTCAAPST